MTRARILALAATALCAALAFSAIACAAGTDAVRSTPAPAQPLETASATPTPTAAQPSATATVNPNPTAAQPSATATPNPTAAQLSATATPTPPAALPTANPTATAIPAPAPTAAQPSATATPNPTPPAMQPTPAPSENPPLIALDGGGASPTVSVGGAAFDVEIAFTPEDRTRGLSGRDSLADGSGMLFVFESGRASSFWMRGMRFALDFVWIGDGCEVVDIHSGVPAPAAGAEVGALPTYSSDPPARYNLEINAGEAAKRGIKIGDAAKFAGFSGEGATCR